MPLYINDKSKYAFNRITHINNKQNKVNKMSKFANKKASINYTC